MYGTLVTLFAPSPQATGHRPPTTSLTPESDLRRACLPNRPFRATCMTGCTQGTGRTSQARRRYLCYSSLGPSPPAWCCSHKRRTDAACSRIGVDPLVFTTKPVHGSCLGQVRRPVSPGHGHTVWAPVSPALAPPRLSSSPS